MSNNNNKSEDHYAQKLAVAAGSLSSLYLLPLMAQAGVITVTGSPVSLAMSAADGTSVEWDVDGLNGSDFHLFRRNTSYDSFNAIFLGSEGSRNGRGLVAPFTTDNVQALQQSFMVGPTVSPYVWGSANYTSRNAMEVSGSNFVIGYDFNFGFAEGDNFFGFRFLSGVDMLYGVGVINFDTTNGIVTIKEWKYNDTADAPVHVGADVPEPGIPALALLGMGAGGVRAWRVRRKAQQAALAA